MFNLAEAGIPEILTLGVSKFHHVCKSTGIHSHSGCLEIGLCLRGALTLVNNGTEYRIMPGDIFLNKPTDQHGVVRNPKGTITNWLQIRAPGKGSFLRLNSIEADDLWSRLDKLPCHITAETESVKQAFAELFKYQSQPASPFRTVALTTTVTSLLLILIELSIQKYMTPHAEVVEKLMRKIRETPEHVISLDDLAREARLSSSLLNAEFKQLCGLPPYQYQLVCRLEKGKQLLEGTTHSITRIALELGFCASQHFSSHFKRAFGVSPKAWRNRSLHLQKASQP